MARKICNHPVFPRLRTKLTALNITICPTCLIRLHIFEIAETQAALERRGGIFASRATATFEEKMGRKQDRVAHRALLRRWRLAKIDSHKDLCLLDRLRAEGDEKARWVLQVNKAFELWKEVETECSRMPGYRYSEDGDYVVTEEKSHVKHDVDFECRLNEDMIDEGSNGNSGGWQTVKLKARAVKQCSDDTIASRTFDTNTEEPCHMEDETCYGTNLEAPNRNLAILQVAAGVPPNIARSSYWDGQNRYDLLREIECEEDANAIEDKEINTRSPFPNQTHRTKQIGALTPRKLPASSSLKRKRSCRLSDKSRLQTQVRITNRITIICDSYACNNTCFQQRQTSYMRPHFSYTTAETARRRLNFYRQSRLYAPHTWAVPDDYENINTSHYKTTWEVYDAIQLLADKEEKRIVQAEEHARLKADDHAVVNNAGAPEEGQCDWYRAITIAVPELKPCTSPAESFSPEPGSDR